MSPQNSDLGTNCSDEDFAKIVLALQEQIQKGEIFQAVPSRSFYLECREPLSAYHYLKDQNPSPYMFYMQTEDLRSLGPALRVR